jgi:hypothetical protein
VVPRSPAFTPLPAFGSPVVSNGGQAAAQAPLHVLFGRVPARHRYKVRPRESTKIFPRPLVARSTLADDALVDGGGVAVAAALLVVGAFEVLELLPPHAAIATSPTATNVTDTTVATFFFGSSWYSFDCRCPDRARGAAHAEPRYEGHSRRGSQWGDTRRRETTAVMRLCA